MKLIYSILFILMTLTACSSELVVQEYPSTASAVDELEKFETDVIDSTAEQINILSPNTFRVVEKWLKDAKDDQQKQKKS